MTYEFSDAETRFIAAIIDCKLADLQAVLGHAKLRKDWAKSSYVAEVLRQAYHPNIRRRLAVICNIPECM